MEWKPASIESVRQIVQDDLANCDRETAAVFETYRVAPRPAPIIRYGKLESVFVVARKDDHVIYWEDVEEGFGVSAVNTDGQVLEHDCNQYNLSMAVNALIGRRGGL